MATIVQIRIYRPQTIFNALSNGMGFVDKVLDDIQRQAKINASVGRYSRTGGLARSIKKEGPRIVGTRVDGSVFTLKSYASSVERGARPHLIEPHRPPWALHFYWEKVGEWVFFDHVNHPGQKGKRFMTRALEKVALRRRLKFVVYERP